MPFNLKSGIMITLCTSNPGFKVDNVMNNVIHLKSRISSLWAKTAYDLQPNLFHDDTGHVAKSCRRLLDYGYVDPTRGGETFRICILGVKGDAPYLPKVGHFLSELQHHRKTWTGTWTSQGCLSILLGGYKFMCC